MQRKIVFINQATGYLTIDIVNSFAREFEEIVLITGSIRVQDIPLDPGVRVRNIIRYNRGNNLNKALSWLIATVQIFFLLRFWYRDHEVFLFTIPPTGYLIAPMLKCLYSIAVFDLFPDALKVNGYGENSLLVRWWSKKNRKVFNSAHMVFTLSEKMEKRILEYSQYARVRIVSNWSAFSGYIPVEKKCNTIIKREKLEGKFVVQYSGNIGATHNVEVLIELAALLKDHKNIEFLIIGRGERSNTIKELIKRGKLTNCRLLPFRKDEELYESLCVADLAVVTLDDRTPDISIPSKVYNILAAGVPIMAIASPDSSISDIVMRHKAGKSFNKEDIKGMSEFIIELNNSPALHKVLSDRSVMASVNYTSANALKYLEFYLRND